MTVSWLAAVLSLGGATAQAAQPAFHQEVLPGLSRFDVGRESRPDLADLDGDGDLDLVAAQRGGTISFFRNTGTSTAPVFVQENRRDNPLFGVDVGGRPAVALGDLDGDGDLDALLGDSAGRVSYFRNAGSSTEPRFEEQSGTDNPFVGVDVGKRSAPGMGDVDGDGDLDVLVGEFAVLHYFRNTGSSSQPAFVEVTGAANPFAGIDPFYRLVDPELEDLDGDGDLDLTLGQAEFSVPESVEYYRNVGSSSAPSYVHQTGADNPFAVVQDLDLPAVALGDLDGDADLDLLLGDYLGDFRYFVNTGSSSQPAYVEETGPGNPAGDGMRLGEFLAPALADIDDDGDADAVLGAEDGQLRLFRNTGSSSSPAYAEAVGSDNPFATVSVAEFSRPTLVDLDGDGDLDTILGGLDGTLRFYRNTGSASAPAFIEETGVGNPFDGFDAGDLSASTFGDLDGDGDLDAVVGEGQGTYRYLRNTGSSSSPAFVEESGTANPLAGFDFGFTSDGVLVDLDEDGDLDLPIASAMYPREQILFYLRNIGSSSAPRFVQQEGVCNPFFGITAGQTQTMRLTLADVDGDGDLDAAVGDRWGHFSFLRNRGEACLFGDGWESGDTAGWSSTVP